MKILVDAMGGDKAPEEIVNGCIDAVNKSDGFDVLLLGDGTKVEKILKERKFDTRRIGIRHTTEIITGNDIPTKAIKSKKDSSLVVGFKMLKEKQGDVLISAGNTGALLTGALLILGRMKGVDRPALAPIIPTKTGACMLIDAGLNTNTKPINYKQFGIIGSIYMKEIFHVESPRVGIINNGTEDTKGTEIVKQAHELLKQCDINFIGNIEGSQIPSGDVDVAVCDGFTGNILLKFLEGMGYFFISGLRKVFSKTIFTKIAAVFLKEELRNFFKQIDYEEYGGTPVLGVDGMVFKCHGSSNSKAVRNAILRAYSFAKSTVIDQIREQFINMEVVDLEA